MSSKPEELVAKLYDEGMSDDEVKNQLADFGLSSREAHVLVKKAKELRQKRGAPAAALEEAARPIEAKAARAPGPILEAAGGQAPAPPSGKTGRERPQRPEKPEKPEKPPGEKKGLFSGLFGKKKPLREAPASLLPEAPFPPVISPSTIRELRALQEPPETFPEGEAEAPQDDLQEFEARRAPPSRARFGEQLPPGQEEPQARIEEPQEQIEELQPLRAKFSEQTDIERRLKAIGGAIEKPAPQAARPLLRPGPTAQEQRPAPAEQRPIAPAAGQMPAFQAPAQMLAESKLLAEEPSPPARGQRFDRAQLEIPRTSSRYRGQLQEPAQQPSSASAGAELKETDETKKLEELNRLYGGAKPEAGKELKKGGFLSSLLGRAGKKEGAASTPPQMQRGLPLTDTPESRRLEEISTMVSETPKASPEKGFLTDVLKRQPQAPPQIEAEVRRLERRMSDVEVHDSEMRRLGAIKAAIAQPVSGTQGPSGPIRQIRTSTFAEDAEEAKASEALDAVLRGVSARKAVAEATLETVPKPQASSIKPGGGLDLLALLPAKGKPEAAALANASQGKASAKSKAPKGKKLPLLTLEEEEEMDEKVAQRLTDGMDKLESDMDEIKHLLDVLRQLNIKLIEILEKKK